MEFNEELHVLMRTWRGRLKCDEIPGLRKQRPKRRGNDVSQADMAFLTGVTDVWYASLEQGKPAAYSDDFLDKVAYSLRLNPDERRVLFYLALGREPRPRPQPPTTSVSAAVRRVLDAQPWPAYVSDASWEILAANQAMAEWLPHISWERNVMRWVYLFPESQVQLIGWAEVWAPSMLAQMRAAKARMPWNTALEQLVDDCLAGSEFARDLWDNQPDVAIHPDGNLRSLYLPYAEADSQPTTVEIVAWTPMRDQDSRIVMLIPVDGYIPPACRPQATAT